MSRAGAALLGAAVQLIIVVPGDGPAGASAGPSPPTVAAVGEPVSAAGDGVIAGYLTDPQFRGGVLIVHTTTFGTVITQYWHVWLRSGFKVGSGVRRGQAFADVADMGARTHLHFAVFNGGFEAHAWNGALPPSACSGFPAFPYRFVDPNVFLEAHQAPVRLPRGVRY